MTPAPSGSHVHVPTPLFIAMSSCYFGDGPRHENRRDPVRQSLAEGEAEIIRNHPANQTGGGPSFSQLRVSRPGMIPRGVAPGAVRPAPAPSDPTTPAPSGTIPSAIPESPPPNAQAPGIPDRGN